MRPETTGFLDKAREFLLKAEDMFADNWPDEVPITEAEIEVFEAWFGDLFDELFSTRH